MVRTIPLIPEFVSTKGTDFDSFPIADVMQANDAIDIGVAPSGKCYFLTRKDGKSIKINVSAKDQEKKMTVEELGRPEWLRTLYVAESQSKTGETVWTAFSRTSKKVTLAEILGSASLVTGKTL